MSVYVDNANHPYRQMIMCHMWADTEEELFAMVGEIGVQNKWIQRPPKASWVHFDISKAKRALAIKLGAIATDKYGPLEYISKLKGDTKMLARIAANRKRIAEGRMK